MPELTIRPADGPSLAATRTGPDGPARIVLLHGLTATRHYTVMGSRHLERAGITTVAYDARGHGRSSPASSPAGYAYDQLADDLVEVLGEVAGGEPAVVLGVSMGAHTAARVALDHPHLVRGLVLVTPAFLGVQPDADYASWDALAGALRGPDPIEAFVRASGLGGLPDDYGERVADVIRQRLGRHRDLAAVADALQGVPRSAPFEDAEQLAKLSMPTVVVGSRDAVDPSHPLAVAERWAELIPGATLEVEDEGRPPLAWSGGRLSRFAEALLGEAR